MKPLHDCAFAGMLPRTMSHETDAFSSKDAATEPKTQSPAEIDDSKQSDEKTSDEKTSDEKTSDETSAKASKSSSAKTKAAKAKAARDEQDSEDEDSDAEDSEGEDLDEQDSDRGKKARDDEERDEEDSDRKAKPSPRAKRRSSSSRSRSRDEDDDERLVPPDTEEAINVPKMHTVYMLSAMSALTIVLWFMAKLTCNIHPDQVRDPKHYSTKDLAADPKNAAYEFHHNFETGDYVTAYDLATGEMRRVVEGKLKECEPTPDECLKNWRKQQGTIQSSGKLLTQSGNRATVELTSERTNVKGPLKSYAFTVEKDGEYWRVSSRREIPTVVEPPVKVPPPAAAAPAQLAPAAANAEAPSPAAPAEQPAAPAEQPAAPAQ